MRWILIGLVGVFMAGPVEAQQISPLTGTTDAAPGAQAPGARPPRAARVGLQQRFDAANATHDGKLTLEQARAGHMPQVARHFDAIDAGHKGFVTVADIKAYRKAARAARRAGRTP